MDAADIAVVAALVIGYSLVARRLDRWSISMPLVFSVVGILVGSDVLGVVDVPVDDEFVGLLAEATLVLVLFADASRIDPRRLRRFVAPPLRLLGIGFPLTVAAGTVLGLLLFPDFDVWDAALLAAVLTPTDAALGQAVVSSPVVPERIRQALNVESGLNDGLAVPVVAITLAVAASTGDRSGGDWAQFVAEQIGFGVVVGVAAGSIGWVLERAVDKGITSEGFAHLAALATAVLAFAAAGAVGGNGFLAAFVAGVVFGSCSSMSEHVVEFAEEEGQLLSALTFLVFGALIAGPAFSDLDAPTFAYAVGSLTVVRMLPVAAALLGSGLRRPSVAFVGWFGPRGLASIIFAFEVLEEGEHLPAADQIGAVVTCTVLLSIMAHGVTATPLSNRLGDWVQRRHLATDETEATAAMDAEMGEAPDLPTRRGM